MGIHRSQEDAYVKEMAKWEHRDVIVNGTPIVAIDHRDGGKKNAPHQEYPKWLYRAENADGGPRICAEAKLVHDEGQELMAVGSGWFVNQLDAIADVHKQNRDHAELAANRAATDRRMSEKARLEAAAADEATMQHLPSIPETPI